MYKKVGSFFFLTKKISTNGVSKLCLNAKRKIRKKNLMKEKKTRIKALEIKEKEKKDKSAFI